jgi:SAM-dependent methyltransferase
MSNQYDKRNVQTMEMLYGEGYLSMGGDDEVAKIVSSIDVAGLDVLDIGCGLGGASITLARDHHARVCGIDIDAGVLERANQLVEKTNLQEQVQLLHFDPGPLPFADHSYDVVYLTAVSCHIEDLKPFLAEIKRIIRPGGCLVGGEWFKASESEAYRQWDELLRDRGLNFFFVTLDGLKQAFTDVGFEMTSMQDQSHRVADLAAYYLQRVEVELQQELVEALGSDEYAALIDWTRIRANALAKGGSGYAHFVATKPSV